MKSWKTLKTKWGRRYRRYVDELNKQNARSGAHETPLSRKKFRELWEASGNLKSKKSKAVEIAKSQVFPGSSLGTARRVASKLNEAGIHDYDMYDIARGEISTRDVAEALNLNEKYHQKVEEGLANGKSKKDAVADAKHWVSWYYYGSK